MMRGYLLSTLADVLTKLRAWREFEVCETRDTIDLIAAQVERLLKP